MAFLYMAERAKSSYKPQNVPPRIPSIAGMPGQEHMLRGFGIKIPLNLTDFFARMGDGNSRHDIARQF
jgi:hypothetical protein